MRVNELYDLSEEGKAKRIWDFVTGKGKKDPARIEPDLTDLSAGAAERAAKPKLRMVDGKPMQVMPDGSLRPYEPPKANVRVEPEAPAPAPKAKADADATTTPKADADAEAPKSFSQSIKKGSDKAWDLSKAGAKYTAGAGLGLGTLAAGDRYILDPLMSDDPFIPALAGNVFQDIGSIYRKGKEVVKPSKPGPRPENLPSASTATEPAKKADDEYTPLKESSKLISELLKLSGQKSITERDNIVGIAKPKKIEALNEDVQLSECGGIMPQSSMNQPASLNISATAGSGDEVAHMLKSIMQLAGLKPVTGDMMPMGDTLPKVSSEPVLTKTISGQLPEGTCGECGSNPCECAMEETYDNTPEPKVEPYDPNNMAHVINKISAKDMSTTPYQSATNPLNDQNDPPKKMEKKVDEDVYHGLFRAYQEFKNSQ